MRRAITTDDLLSLAYGLRQRGEHGQDRHYDAEYSALIRVAEVIEEWAHVAARAEPQDK